MGTEFKIYDNGLNPKKCAMWDRIRAEIGVILYVILNKNYDFRFLKIILIYLKESNMLSSKKPRKM